MKNKKKISNLHKPLSAIIGLLLLIVAQPKELYAQWFTFYPYVTRIDFDTSLHLNHIVNYTAASGALTALDTDIQNYPTHLQNELSDYISFKEKMIDLFVADIPLDNLSETDHNFMTDLAENGEGLARYQAQELLCFFYNECAEYPVITETQTSMAPLFQDKDTERSRSERSFKIYPNPAQSWVAIELPEVDSPLIITVVDLSGRLIYQKELGGINGTERLSTVEIWDTQLIGEGVYLITIVDVISTESYGTQRVVIQH